MDRIGLQAHKPEVEEGSREVVGGGVPAALAVKGRGHGKYVEVWRKAETGN
jgi:hypothetical protein